ncbi:MAG: thiamine pyrophosphate-binding protein, partial [Pseudolabrys sp.]|nr:thiamine pyrophosphate-binding protein [Pseudolabrys sp.]
MKYSDQIGDWLVELGYTHCFFVAGGNIMHLLESANRRFTCMAFIHEVAAGVAVEYFNEVSDKGRAFALVTAGPGLTNIVTAVAGAYLESRELLVIGGQVKTADLSRKKLRQRGIQEIDGAAIVAPITVESVLVDDVLDRNAFTALAEAGSHGRKGPVFLEIPLDIQGRDVDPAKLSSSPAAASNDNGMGSLATDELDRLARAIRDAKRPAILLGGGVSRETMRAVEPRIAEMGIPVMTTWNGFDRVGADNPCYFGRPNTWGQRYANLVMQQADLLIALGSRLGLQQTGFNWQQFIPAGKVVQVECDKVELEKGHPRVDWPIHGDANNVLRHLSKADLGTHSDWLAYCRDIKTELPLSEAINETRSGYLSPYEFCLTL